MYYFGIIGLICVQSYHVPSLWRLYHRYKTGSDLADVSMPAYSLLLIGLLSYTIYGFGTDAWLYVAGSCLGAAQVGLTLYLLRKART